jgi:3-(3-hydroxy-phenyl)propionate hydroxylase
METASIASDRSEYAESSVKRTDVLIIGAGPTGLTLANILGAAGVRAILIDKKEGPVEDPRAVSVDDAALRIMQSVKLLDEVLLNGVAGTGMRFRGSSGKIIARTQSALSEVGFPKRTNVHQPVFEATLLNGVYRYKNIEVLMGHELTEIKAGLASTGNDQPALAQFKNASGGVLHIQADIVACCDGGRSPTRKLLGVPMDGRTFEQRWLVLDTIDVANTERETDVYCDPARPRVRIPGPGHHVRWEFMIRPSESSEAFLETGYRDLLKRYRGSDEVVLASKRVYTFHARMARRWSVGNVYLLGDAAHLNPPFGGQGMINGIRDASNFGWKCAAILKSGFARELLATYESERRCSMQDSIDFSLRMGNLMMPNGVISGWCNAAALTVGFKIPAVRDHIVQQKHRPKPRLGEGFATGVAMRGSNALVGRLLPQPTIRDHLGNTMRLDDALGAGFALVAGNAQVMEAFLAGAGSALTSFVGRCVIVSDEQPGLAPGASEIVQDLDGSINSIFSSLRRHVLLVRPDRYIAALFPVDSSEHSINAFIDTVKPYLPSRITSKPGDFHEAAIV